VTPSCIWRARIDGVHVRYVSVSLIIELLVEIIVELVIELAIYEGAGALARVLATRTARGVAVSMLGLGAGGWAGYAWGAHVADSGQEAIPRSLWVSFVLAAAALTSAVLIPRRQTWQERLNRLPTMLKPTPSRLVVFALLSTAVAVGILIGFN
jgi:hypothetical protein